MVLWNVPEDWTGDYNGEINSGIFEKYLCDQILHSSEESSIIMTNTNYPITIDIREDTYKKG